MVPIRPVRRDNGELLTIPRGANALEPKENYLPEKKEFIRSKKSVNRSKGNPHDRSLRRRIDCILYPYHRPCWRESGGG